MANTDTQVRELGRRWAEAEQRGDTTTLATLVTDDFRLVGPLGFILDRDQWLQRYRSGDLVTHELAWDEISVRDYGDAAVAIGRHTQRASFKGNSVDGTFRATHVLIRSGDDWRLAGIQLSPIGAPPAFTNRGNEAN